MKYKDQTKIKVASLLYSIYMKCEIGSPFVLRQMIEELKLTSNASPVIKQFELFERVGKTEGGHLFKWKKEAPNEQLFEAIALAIQDYTRNTNKPKEKPQPEPISEPVAVAPAKNNDHFIVPELPQNMPGPLQAACNMIIDYMKQQTAYILAMGGAVEDMQTKVDTLYTQLK